MFTVSSLRVSGFDHISKDGEQVNISFSNKMEVVEQVEVPLEKMMHLSEIVTSSIIMLHLI